MYLANILIIKAGHKLDSLFVVPGDFEDWISSAMQLPKACFNVVSVYKDELLPAAETVDAVVISGSGAMITDHSDWIETTAQWLQGVVHLQKPVLGICFGHQLLAYALGGNVDINPNGVEVGSVDVEVVTDADDVLFSGLKQFQAQASHRQAVLQLPRDATLLAQTSMDAHHAFRVGNNCWGVQFHPEFNAEISRHYIDYYVDDLNATNRDSVKMKQQCNDTEVASALLVRFANQIGTDK